MVLLNPILTGLMAAVFSIFPRMVQNLLGGDLGEQHRFWIGASSLGFLLLASIGAHFIPFKDRLKGPYDGIVDLVHYVHGSTEPGSAFRWFVRALISFVLVVFGGLAGPEGVAIEASHAYSLLTRSRFSRWFEYRRRTDVGMALSAGVSAAFGAPFAGAVLPMELGIGGSPVSSIIASLIAFLATKNLLGFTSIGGFDVAGSLHGVQVLSWSVWLAVLCLGVLGGLLSLGVLLFYQYARGNLRSLFADKPFWVLPAVGVVLLWILYTVSPLGHLPSWTQVEKVVWAHWTWVQTSRVVLTQLLSLGIVLVVWGTTGVVWPLLSIGTLIGGVIYASFFEWIPGFGPLAAFVSASAFFGGILGAPITGALLCYELTGNLAVLLPCWMAGLIASLIRGVFRRQNWIEETLKESGLFLREGRSTAVLDALTVAESVSRDGMSVQEHEGLDGMITKLRESRYAFLAVVNAQGRYLGILTIDQILERASERHLKAVVEAKDLLYRSRQKHPVVQETDSLKMTLGLFKEIPCVPVVNRDHQWVGFLFSSDVRLAYDREVSRQALQFQLDGVRAD